jgi:hypothetical protein
MEQGLASVRLVACLKIMAMMAQSPGEEEFLVVR